MQWQCTKVAVYYPGKAGDTEPEKLVSMLEKKEIFSPQNEKLKVSHYQLNNIHEQKCR